MEERAGNESVTGAFDGSGVTADPADLLDGTGRQAEVLKEMLVGIGMSLLEQRVQPLFLLFRDPDFIEQGHELIFSDRFHGGYVGLSKDVFDVRDCALCSCRRLKRFLALRVSSSCTPWWNIG